VKIWFQNRRTKWKKQDNISNAEAAEHKVQASKSGGKRDKTASLSQSSRAKQDPGGRKSGIPTTSECSLSISESVDGDDSSGDHSNGSPLTHDDLLSDEGAISELGRKTPTTPLLGDHSNNKHNHGSSIISNNSTHQHSPPDSPEMSPLPPLSTEQQQESKAPGQITTQSSPRGTPRPPTPEPPALKGMSPQPKTLSDEGIQFHPGEEESEDPSLSKTYRATESPTQFPSDPIS